jgi:peptidoglycan/LPS O-acetylase OafA/YrhL
MQFFILSPIVLVLYIKVHKIIGWAAVFSACACGIITSGTIAHHFDLNVSAFAPSNGSNQFNYYYVKPYCRVPPYALGLACGMILYTYRKHQDKGQIYDPIAYFIAKALKNIFVRCGMFFVGLAERTTYGIGISFIFLPLLLGYFKPLADFLSFSAWSFIARLNFVIYLIHLSVMQTVWKSQKTVYEYDMYTNVSQSIYFFVFVAICALPIVLAIEMPAANLEKLLFARGIPKKNALNEDLVVNETVMSKSDKELKCRD